MLFLKVFAFGFFAPYIVSCAGEKGWDRLQRGKLEVEGGGRGVTAKQEEEGNFRTCPRPTTNNQPTQFPLPFSPPLLTSIYPVSDSPVGGQKKVSKFGRDNNFAFGAALRDYRFLRQLVDSDKTGLQEGGREEGGRGLLLLLLLARCKSFFLLLCCLIQPPFSAKKKEDRL